MTSMNAAPLCDSGALDQRHQLGLVAREAAPDVAGPQLQGQAHQIDRLVVVDDAALRLRAGVGGGRELALGQAVHPVVLDDVGHVDAAPDRVGELAEPDRGGVAVAGDAQVDQLAVGHVGAGEHGRHPPVHGVEAVRVAEEIVRSLRRAADAGELGQPMRRQVELEGRLDDRRRDRVVPAAGAQGGDLALVVAPREAEAVRLQERVMETRLGDVGHSAKLTRLPAGWRRAGPAGAARSGR